MSWNPLRVFGPAKSSSSSSMGAGSSQPKDSDEFEQTLKDLAAVEQATSRLKKEAKKVNETIIAMNRAEIKLTDDLSNSNLCQQYDPTLRSLTEEWHTFNRQLTTCSEDLHINVLKLVHEPVKRLQGAHKEVRALLKKRDHEHQEIVNWSGKVAKLTEKEKTGPNLVKLEQAKQTLATHEEEFGRYNSILMQELGAFIEARVDYFQPSLEGLVRSEALFWGDTVQALNDSPRLNTIQDQCVGSNWNEYVAKQESLMRKLSALSIVEGNS